MRARRASNSLLVAVSCAMAGRPNARLWERLRSRAHQAPGSPARRRSGRPGRRRLVAVEQQPTAAGSRRRVEGRSRHPHGRIARRELAFAEEGKLFPMRERIRKAPYVAVDSPHEVRVTNVCSRTADRGTAGLQLVRLHRPVPRSRLGPRAGVRDRRELRAGIRWARAGGRRRERLWQQQVAIDDQRGNVHQLAPAVL